MSVEELKHNQDVMIQLPWTVPQQPLYTANIQVDPETQKIPLDLSHSTDTTAISSFVFSILLAVCLCGFATWLAYWYGVRSFKATKLSFDIVKDQIKSSEALISSSNKELIQTSLAVKTLEIRDHHKILILDILTEFESHLFTLKIYLKALSDQKSEQIELLAPQAKESYKQFQYLQFKLNNYLRANHDLRIDSKLEQIFLKINQCLDKAQCSLGLDNDLIDIIELGAELLDKVHDEIKKAT